LGDPGRPTSLASVGTRSVTTEASEARKARGGSAHWSRYPVRPFGVRGRPGGTGPASLGRAMAIGPARRCMVARRRLQRQDRSRELSPDRWRPLAARAGLVTRGFPSGRLAHPLSDGGRSPRPWGGARGRVPAAASIGASRDDMGRSDGLAGGGLLYRRRPPGGHLPSGSGWIGVHDATTRNLSELMASVRLIDGMLSHLDSALR
jgi:hypothetical protein